MEFFCVRGGGEGRGRQGALWEMCDSRIDLFTCMFCFANGDCVIIL